MDQRTKDYLNLVLGFATCAHKDQKRKYTGESYVTHCRAVMEILAKVTDDVNVLSAALLHDTIEDTSVTYENIKEVFNERIADLVREVTDVSTLDNGSREVRKKIDRQHLAKSSPDGATIKLADLIHNTESIVKHDKGFARIYLTEKESLLPFLSHGNIFMYLLAKESLKRAQLQLGLGEQT